MSKQNRKVAILAVHGIGKHAAGETQTAVADLLLSLPGRGAYAQARRYTAFRKVDLALPMQPVHTPTRPVTTPLQKGGTFKKNWRKAQNVFQEGSADFALAMKQAGRDMVPGHVGPLYTRMLLEGYKGGASSNVYTTARLQGQRLEDGAKVDIYEVFWSDLAKPDNSVLRFFLALFQLLLHLAGLSRLALDTGAAESTGKLWSAYRRTQRYAIRLFQIVIPVLEFLLLITLAACLTESWSVTSGKIVVPILIGVLGSIGVHVLRMKKATRAVRGGPGAWAFRPIFWIVLGASLGFSITKILTLALGKYGAVNAPVWGVNFTAALAFWVVAGGGLTGWLLSYYKDFRHGVQLLGWILFSLSFVSFVIFFCHAPATLSALSPGLRNQTGPVALATFWTAEFLLAAIRLCWGALIGGALIASILGALAWRQTKRNGGEWGRARAAVRTSRFTLALPAVLFMFITVLIWKGFLTTAKLLSQDRAPIFNRCLLDAAYPSSGFLEKLEGTLLPPHDLIDALPPCATAAVANENKQTPYSASMTRNDAAHTQPVVPISDANDYAVLTMAWSVSYAFPIIVLIVLVAAFLLVWWVLPSVQTEAVVPRGVDEAPRDTDDKVSVRLGTWMSRGLDATSVVSWLLWIGIFLVPTLYLLFYRFHPGADKQLRQATELLIENTAVGFVALVALAKRGQTVLSTILDVDTYLRSTPSEATPRAKIFERYISTLRYLRSVKFDDDEGYDEIVIVAHSLGALISADLLLYLQSELGKPEWSSETRGASDRPKLTNIPLTLMTMGNPLQQLLNRFFPYLYAWVRSTPPNGKAPAGPPLDPGQATITDDALPNPAALGLARWVNAYRSGDYVGRGIWLDEWFHRPKFSSDVPEPTVASSPSGTRQEMCIGAGAHVRYMDDTAPDIAWKLDSLI